MACDAQLEHRGRIGRTQPRDPFVAIVPPIPIGIAQRPGVRVRRQPEVLHLPGVVDAIAGILHVANSLNHTIEKISPTGADLGVFGTAGGEDSHGLAFDSAGNLYQTNGFPSGIGKYGPDGAGLGFFHGPSSEPLFLAFTDDADVPLKLANQLPEPSPWALLALGLPALASLSRPRRRAGHA